MDTAFVSALAGIFGSLSGDSASVATTWLAHNRPSKREARLAELAKREALYGEFINECSTRIMDSFERNLDNRKHCCRPTRCSIGSGFARPTRCSGKR
jgi:hypothetical protein